MIKISVATKDVILGTAIVNIDFIKLGKDRQIDNKLDLVLNKNKKGTITLNYAWENDAAVSLRSEMLMFEESQKP